MKKFTLFGIILSAAMLTSCKEYREGDVTSVPDETTSLTLTVSLTEAVPPPEPVPQLIEFAVYDPFTDVVKTDSSTRKELAEAVEKLSDGRAFLYAGTSMFYKKSKYVAAYGDTSNYLERNKEYEYDYCPLNPDIAQTEEELVQYIRSCFTENYISDEELHKTLFESENVNVAPAYKTIDGTLCIRLQYTGVAPDIDFEKFSVLSYDGNSARVAAFGETAAYPPTMTFIDMVKSEEYGWRLDGMEMKNFYPDEAEVMYNAVVLRTDTLNKILGGGSVPQNAKITEIDGETYTQTDLDMTIAEIYSFFEETFNSDYCAKTYVTGIYAERDGILYRRDSAPRWYLPEMRLEPCSDTFMSGGNYDDEMELTCEQEFYDSITGESLTRNVRVVYGCEYLGYNTEERRNEYEYKYIHVTSELPIRELDSEAFNEVIKPIVDKKREELDLSDKPFGVTDIYRGTMFDYNNDGHDDYIFGYSLYAQFQLVIIDSQNGDILFDERIMTHLLPSTKLEIYVNDNSEYAIKISFRNEKPAVSHTDETIHIITASGESIFEALYDYETGAFLKAYSNDYDEDTEEKYLQKQEELLEGYAYYADIDWTLLRD